jgi:hypothetical protein
MRVEGRRLSYKREEWRRGLGWVEIIGRTGQQVVGS